MFNINKLTLMATFAAAFLAAPSVSGTALPESCRKAPVSVRMMLSEMARTRSDFTEADIETRTAEIIDSFVDYLGEVGLLAD